MGGLLYGGFEAIPKTDSISGDYATPTRCELVDVPTCRPSLINCLLEGVGNHVIFRFWASGYDGYLFLHDNLPFLPATMPPGGKTLFCCELAPAIPGSYGMRRLMRFGIG